MTDTNAHPPKMWYTIKECYFSDECSPQSLARAQLWSETEDGCRKAFRRHLDSSSLHAVREDWEKDCAAEAVEVVMDEWKPPTKKQKKDHGDGGGSCSNSSAWRGPQHATDGVPAAAAAQVVSQLAQLLGGGQAATPPSAANTLARWGQNQGAITRYGNSGVGDMISIRREVLQGCIDALERSSEATEHARTMLSTGANAFAEETNRIASALRTVRAAVSEADRTG
jgi:hypothetical protein